MINRDLKDIVIRNHIIPGDLGYLIHMHGKIYREEYGYGISFEAYVAKGIFEFYASYDPSLDRVWICEHNLQIIGSLFLIHRENQSAQLRYFLIVPGFRGGGLGKKLMDMYLQFMMENGYKSSYLWTTPDLQAAAALYNKNGFCLTMERPGDFFGKPVTEQRYDLVL